MAPRKASAKATGDVGEPPKKPLSGYFLFCADNRKRISDANPDFKLGQVAKALGTEWQNLDPKEKKKYEAKNAEEKERYAKELEAYIAAGGDPNAKRSKKAAAKPEPVEKVTKKKAKKVESEPEVTDESVSDE